MTAKTFRPLVAECVGTALFIFLGAGSMVVNAMTVGRLGTVGIALAHGLAMAIIVSATLAISGGHINPAVTLGVWVAKKIDGRTAVNYWIAQFVGAIVGAAFLKLVMPWGPVKATSLGTPLLSPIVTFWQGVGIEAILTFFLLCAVFGTAVSSEAPKVGGFGVGVAILVGGIAAGDATGAVMNPARALGPALVSWTWAGQVVWWIGPAIGAIVAGLLWKAILLPRDPAQL